MKDYENLREDRWRNVINHVVSSSYYHCMLFKLLLVLIVSKTFVMCPKVFSCMPNLANSPPRWLCLRAKPHGVAFQNGAICTWSWKLSDFFSRYNLFRNWNQTRLHVGQNWGGGGRICYGEKPLKFLRPCGPAWRRRNNSAIFKRK